MTSEKDLLLSVASVEEWWKWADDPWGHKRTTPEHQCLLCLAYATCSECKKAGRHHARIAGCMSGSKLSSEESAARRLIRAGIERPKGA